jgi:hypothetical protein
VSAFLGSHFTTLSFIVLTFFLAHNISKLKKEKRNNKGLLPSEKKNPCKNSNSLFKCTQWDKLSLTPAWENPKVWERRAKLKNYCKNMQSSPHTSSLHTLTHETWLNVMCTSVWSRPCFVLLSAYVGPRRRNLRSEASFLCGFLVWKSTWNVHLTLVSAEVWRLLVCKSICYV